MSVIVIAIGIICKSSEYQWSNKRGRISGERNNNEELYWFLEEIHNYKHSRGAKNI